MTTLPNVLTVSTDVGNVAWPTCSNTTSGASPSTSATALPKRRDSLKRAFSSSGDSPPLRIIPLYSLRSIQPSAPSRSTSSPFSAEETTPTDVAPAALQSCVANTPRPPAAPQIRTRSPAWMLHCVISMRYAVKYTSPYDAASSQLRFFGFGISCWAWTLVNCANEPQVVS